jgi:hypothetical protein
MNFWGLLLYAAIAGIDFLLTWLFGGAEGKHHALGLANIIGYNAYVVLEVTYATFGNFNMTLPLVTIGVSMGAWITRLLISIYLYIRLLIQGGGR